LPAGKGTVQKLDLGGLEFAAAALLPLSVDPHSKGVFLL
jgi:hypothetical protein